MTDKEDRREFERYPLAVPARLTIHQKDGSTVDKELRTQNISAGGALVQTDHMLETGTLVEVQLTLPMDRLREVGTGQVEVRLSGRVVRSADTGAVIGFDKAFEIAAPKPVRPALPVKLTPREHQILDLISSGASNQDIADTLSIRLTTVKSHVYGLYKKIKVKNRFQAILWYSHHR